MLYKRSMSFRYTFTKPIDAFFRISKVDGDEVNSSEGKAMVLDISPGGAKLISDLNIPDLANKNIELSVRFDLDERAFDVIGLLIWKKEKGKTIEYGVQFYEDKLFAKDLTEQLKIHSKKAAIVDVKKSSVMGRNF